MRAKFLAFTIGLLIGNSIISQAGAADSLPAAKTPVRTLNKNDVQTQITDQGGSTLLNVQAQNTSPGAGGGAHVLPAVAQSSLPTLTAGNLSGLTVDTSGRIYVTTDSGANLNTNLAQVSGASISASNPVPSRLSDGTVFYKGASSLQFPTSIGQTNSAGSLSVTIASDQSSVATKNAAPSGASFNRATPVNIASAGTTAIVCKGSLAASQTLAVYRVRVTGAALARCVVRYNDNGSFTNFGDVITSAASPNGEIQFPAGFAKLTTSATPTTQQIEANCTNFDTSAQDFGCDVNWCQSAAGCP
jgi:hypothetical protein